MIVANIMTFGRIYDTRSFEFTVKTDNLSAGSSTATQFKLPVTSTGFTPFNVDWGDGTFSYITSSVDPNLLHQYPIAGTYNVKCSGVCTVTFNSIQIPPTDVLKILVISKVDGLNIVVSNAFTDCSNMTWTASESPIINSPNLFFTFLRASNFNGNISSWNVSSVVTMQAMFQLATLFNQNINNWSTGNVVTMTTMFATCPNFNQPLNNLNTGNVTNMSGMFISATLFNQPLNNWNTSKVTNMATMFSSATNFNGNISTWNTGNVTSMVTMFEGASNFNSNISGWNVSKVKSMNGMFIIANSFNQPIGIWNTENVTDMQRMFRSNTIFNQPLINWNTSKVTNMFAMFQSAPAFNQNIGNWNVSLVTNFTSFMAGKTFLNYSTANYDSLLNGWTNRTFALPELTLDFGTIRRSANGTEARELMTRPNVTVNVTNAINNGSGLIRVTATAHGMSTGNKVFISGVVGAIEANGGFNVTVIDLNTIDLQSSVFVNTYVSGGTVRTGWGHTVNDGGI
jgi:surface protein